METNILNILLEQAPVIIVMGLAIWYLMKKNTEIEKTIVKKDDNLIKITEQVLKVATLWDVKSDLNTDEHKTIIDGVNSLTKLAEKISYECTAKK